MTTEPRDDHDDDNDPNNDGNETEVTFSEERTGLPSATDPIELAEVVEDDAPEVSEPETPTELEPGTLKHAVTAINERRAARSAARVIGETDRLARMAADDDAAKARLTPSVKIDERGKPIR